MNCSPSADLTPADILFRDRILDLLQRRRDAILRARAYNAAKMAEADEEAALFSGLTDRLLDGRINPVQYADELFQIIDVDPMRLGYKESRLSRVKRLMDALTAVVELVP